MSAVPSNILELMKKLANMTVERGCSPSEAMSAAARLQSMLADHQLSMADLDGGSIGEGVEQEHLGIKDRYGHIKKWRRSVIYYAGHIGWAFDCKTVQCGTRISFIGISSDVKVAKFFFETTWQAILDAGVQQGRFHGKRGQHLISYYDQFLMGAANAIYGRLKPTVADQPDSASVQTAALVPIKEKKVEEFMSATYGKLKDDKYKPRARDGWSGGYRHGMNIELSRGMGSSAPAGALEGGAA